VFVNAETMQPNETSTKCSSSKTDDKKQHPPKGGPRLEDKPQN